MDFPPHADPEITARAPVAPSNGQTTDNVADNLDAGAPDRLTSFPPPYPEDAGKPSRFGPVLVAGNPEPPTRMEIWVNRLFLVIRVVFWIELGLMLVVLPWTQVWTSNSLLLRWPGIRALLAPNFVRGAMSGLGLLDIWIGIADAVHYRDRR